MDVESDLFGCFCPYIINIDAWDVALFFSVLSSLFWRVLILYHESQGQIYTIL